MNKKYPLIVVEAAVVFSLASGCAIAEMGGGAVARHPNIAAADDFTARAIDRMRDAQSANDDHMGGHAARAIQLLEEARREMALAADELR